MLQLKPPLKILLIDPIDKTRRYYWQFLKECGEVITAHDTYGAELLYLQHHPHIIVTDLFNPLMKGLELLRKFQRQYRSIYAYYVIGLISPTDPQPENRAAIDPCLMEVLIKPVYIGQLLSTVRELGKEIRTFRDLEKEAS